MLKLDLKGRESRDQIVNIHWITEKEKSSQKMSTSGLLTTQTDHNKLWKILQEMGIPDHLTCLLRNLYAGQEATLRTGHGTMDWFQTGKGVHQGCILSLCLYSEHIMRDAGLDETQVGIRLLGEISITSDMQICHPGGRK